MNLERKTMYHFTSLKNVENILKCGLLTNSNKKTFAINAFEYYKLFYEMQPIFLVRNPIRFYNTNIPEVFFKKEKLTLLRVDVSEVNLEKEHDYLIKNPYIIYSPIENELERKKFEDKLKQSIKKQYFKDGGVYITKENIPKEKIKIYLSTEKFLKKII